MSIRCAGSVVGVILLIILTLLYLNDDKKIETQLDASSSINRQSEQQHKVSSSTTWRVGDPSLVHKHLRKTEANLESILGGCRPTTHIELVVATANNTNDKDRKETWILRTYSDSNVTKTIGGDEFYVSFTRGNNMNKIHVTAAAIIKDRKDGSYELHFIASPMNDDLDHDQGTGFITIYHEHTCDIGRVSPPNKDGWKAGGAINAAYKIPNVKAPLTIAPFRFKPIPLTKYDVVEMVGDSLIRQFATESGRQQILKYTKCPGVMSLTTWSTFVDCAKTAIANHENDNDNKRVALIVGHSVWDILNDESQGDFEDHIQACSLYIEKLRELAPTLDLYWKSGTAMQMHEVQGDNYYKVGRVLYMSSSRAARLYELQMALMKDLDVQVLDVFRLTYLSADWLKSGDGRHYQSVFTKHMVDRFFE